MLFYVATAQVVAEAVGVFVVLRAGVFGCFAYFFWVGYGAVGVGYYCYLCWLVGLDVLHEVDYVGYVWRVGAVRGFVGVVEVGVLVGVAWFVRYVRAVGGCAAVWFWFVG